MTGLERITAALRGEKPDRIPVMLHNFMAAAAEREVSMGKFREDPGIMADVFKHSVEKYALDGVVVDLDTVTLAGSVGVKVDLPEDAPGRSHHGMLAKLEDIRKQKKVRVEDYKYIGIWLEAVRILKDYFGTRS